MTRIGIIGGGIGGLAAAIALRRLGLAPVVFEQAAAFGRVGADINLTPNAVRALDDLQVSLEPGVIGLGGQQPLRGLDHPRSDGPAEGSEQIDAVAVVYRDEPERQAIEERLATGRWSGATSSPFSCSRFPRTAAAPTCCSR